MLVCEVLDVADMFYDGSGGLGWLEYNVEATGTRKRPQQIGAEGGKLVF